MVHRAYLIGAVVAVLVFVAVLAPRLLERTAPADVLIVTIDTARADHFSYTRLGFPRWPRGERLTDRTAVYGPVCAVVWEGRSREASPYPYPRAASLWLTYANISFERERWAESVRQYRKAAELGADGPELQRNLPEALRRLERPAVQAESVEKKKR